MEIRTLAVETRVPNDPTGTAIGLSFSAELREALLRGLPTVKNLTPSLAPAAKEILEEFEDSNNAIPGTEMRWVKIDRRLSKKALRKGKLKVLDCDKRKILALLAALFAACPGDAMDYAQGILEPLKRGGIPVKVELRGHLEKGVSVFIRVFDESLELKPVIPS